jgi:hypothetical protein
MRILITILSILAVLCGAMSAYTWYLASHFKLPLKLHQPHMSETEFDHHLTQQFAFGLFDVVEQGSRLNRRAALWTALAVGLGSVANLLSLWAI